MAVCYKTFLKDFFNPHPIYNYEINIREIGLKISRLVIFSKAPTAFLKIMSKKKNLINAYRVVG